jgi:hypothetical protein
MDSKMTDQKIELVDDTQVLNEDFKKNVAIPYFKDIYKDLVQQSDNKNKGINKLSILTVSFSLFYIHASFESLHALFILSSMFIKY